MTVDERLVSLLHSAESLRASVQGMTATVHETSASAQAVRATMQETSRTVQKLVVAASADGENIRALARIAERHERRISTIDGTTNSDLDS